MLFALPPAELGVHPGDGNFVQAHADQKLLGSLLYLMCDDLPSMIRSLEAKKVKCTAVTKAGWGITTTVRLPSGGKIGLYQPRHRTAIG